MTHYLAKVAVAILVFLLFVFAGWLLSLPIRRLGKHETLQRNRVYRLIAGSINAAILMVGVVFTLGTLGVNVTALIGGLGLGGFAIGLTLKDAISNFVAGLMVVIYAPIELGDTIDVGGIKGKVIDINLRYVTLQTESDIVLIPNGNFLTGVIRKSL